MGKQLKDISICVVTHNNKIEVKELLDSIYKYTEDIDFEVFLVDNASSDGTAESVEESFPAVSVIKSEKNLGFGRAHNLVLNKINSKYHLILNPDVMLPYNAIKEVFLYLEENNDVVIATTKVLYPDGRPQNLPKKNPRIKYILAGKLEKCSNYFKKIREEYTMYSDSSAKHEPFSIDFCTGCFMMVRSDIFKKLNGFDENFFMYMEDADLSRRARKYGTIKFLPKTEIIHAWHRDSSKKFKFFLIHLISLFKYLVKWRKD